MYSSLEINMGCNVLPYILELKISSDCIGHTMTHLKCTLEASLLKQSLKTIWNSLGSSDLYVHWLSVHNGKRRCKRRKIWGRRGAGWEGEERKSSLHCYAFVLWKRCGLFSARRTDSKLSSKMRCWGVESSQGAFWDIHVSKHCSYHSLPIFTIWISIDSRKGPDAR